jgi:hypothetical protein
MRPKLWPASNHRLTLQNPEGPDIVWTSLHAARLTVIIIAMAAGFECVVDHDASLAVGRNELGREFGKWDCT